jgi:hypothetical protein
MGKGNQKIAAHGTVKSTRYVNSSPQWTCASKIQEPRIDAVLMINMAAREYSDIFALGEVLCADRALAGLILQLQSCTILDDWKGF